MKEAIWPVHPRRPQRVENIHEIGEEKRILDPYAWLKTMTEKEKDLFDR